MKRTVINIALVLAILGCLVWAASSSGIVTFIPTFLAICVGIGLLYYNTDYIQKQ